MKDQALVIVGALSSVCKNLIDLQLKESDELKFILIDLPQKKEKLAAYRKEMAVKHGSDRFHIFCADVRDKNSIDQIFNHEIFSSLLVKRTVYAAGINYIRNTFLINEDDYDRLMDINTRGFFFLAKKVAAKMIADSESGSIVAIASQHGVEPNFNRSVYCASKAALIMLAKAFALEWADYSIRVNTVAPTMIVSAGNKRIINYQSYADSVLDSIPLRRYATPLDVASTIDFLLSDKASMITGENILVDGGWHLKN